MIHRLVLIAMFMCMASLGFADGSDGFPENANKIESQHFTVFYQNTVDLDMLLGQLNVTDADQLLTGQTIDNSNAQVQLASNLDILFSRACDVLDMHVTSFRGNIKIFASHQELADFFDKMFHKPLPCTGSSFYLYDYNSIYISADNFRREVLGHEMGHAIISSYFVVQPSMKIQEVLAGYVEYQLRKSK